MTEENLSLEFLTLKALMTRKRRPNAVATAGAVQVLSS